MNKKNIIVFSLWVDKPGCKFNYLEPKFGSEFQTTNLLNDTIIHMWHQRERWQMENYIQQKT